MDKQLWISTFDSLAWIIRIRCYGRKFEMRIDYRNFDKSNKRMVIEINGG